MLLSGFVCNYVPSEKGIEELCNYLLIPSLRRLAAEVMSPYMEKVQGMLDEAAEKINKVMKESGLEDIKACFKFPNNSVEELIRGFDFRLLDPMETTIYMKGLGIQSIALLSSFIWITEKEKTQDKEVIWLLEEPESYLHPELFVICEKILEKLREEALVLITSHSINFVPRNHLKVVGTELDNNRTIIKSYKSHQEATESLRKSLGVKFSDYFNLSRYNIFVEGPSDREYLNWIIKILSNKDGLNYQYLFSNQTLIKDFGGVANLAGFLKANYELIRKERAVVSVFDGDDAGRNRTSELQHYFGEKGGFNVNKDYVSMPDGFPIEGLFPDNWIIDCHSQHEGWFERYSVDALGKLQYFTLVDGKRNNFAEKMKEKAEEQPDLKWAEKWEKTCQCINNALRLLEEGLKH
jgi:predicted ATP-dependent endonuclease of OLD family